MNNIDGYELWFRHGNSFDYKNEKNGAWVQYDFNRNEVVCWALDEEDEERAVRVKISTLNKIAEDAKKRIKWN